MGRILVAEDDELLGKTLVHALSEAGYAVDRVDSGKDAVVMCEIGAFDLLILDFNLPGLSGLQVCQAYRRMGRAEPVLFLTSRGEINDKTAAFECGADDYMTKPFQLLELLARVKALLRRPVAIVDESPRIGEAVFNVAAGSITHKELVVKLQPKEAALLEFLVKRPEQVIPAESLMAAVWGADFEGSEVALRVCLTKIRKALAVLGLERTIVTVHGFGYQFQPNKTSP